MHNTQHRSESGHILQQCPATSACHLTRPALHPYNPVLMFVNTPKCRSGGMVDAAVSKTVGATHVGSTPTFGIFFRFVLQPCTIKLQASRGDLEAKHLSLTTISPR